MYKSTYIRYESESKFIKIFKEFSLNFSICQGQADPLRLFSSTRAQRPLIFKDFSEIVFYNSFGLLLLSDRGEFNVAARNVWSSVI